MKVGFTGSRNGMNEKQINSLKDFLIKIKSLGLIGEDEFHHGDCIGSDEEAFKIAHELGWKTIAHPCTLSSLRAYTDSDIILNPAPPLARNKNIVNVSDVMVATPGTNFEVLRSGTWATIRYARYKQKLSNSNIFYPSRN